MSTNYLAQFSANLSTISAVNINYSTLTGSTIIASSIISNSTINVSTITARAINYSTLTGSTMTINTLVIASTLTVSTLIATNNPAGVITSSMISLGASTNQSYTTNTNWLSTLNNLSSTKFVSMSGNAQTQLAVTQMNTTTSIYYTSTLAQNWSTISNVTGLPTATQTNYTCGAVSGNGQYGLLGTSNGYLYLTSTLTSAVGPSFTTVNPPPTAPSIYFPFDGSIIDSRANVTATAVGTTAVPQYVTGTAGSNALYLANPSPGNLTPVAANAISIPYPVSSYPNMTISLWFNLPVSVATGSQTIFSCGNGTNIVIHVYIANSLIYVVVPTGTGTGATTIGPSPTITTNTWYNFTFTFQAGGRHIAYLNGTSFATYTNTGGYGSYTVNSIIIGAGNSGTLVYSLNGYIDEFRLYNYAIPYPFTYNNVAISNSGQYMLATIANGGLVMSSNFGSSWSQVSAALLQAMWSLLEISLTGQYMSVYAPPVTATPQFAGITAGITGTWTVNNIVWTVSASTYVNDSYYPTNIFNNSVGSSSWASGSNSYNPTYPSSGTNTIILGVGTIYGDWLQLRSSVPLVMNSYTFMSGGTVTQMPRNYYIVGSNDSTNWYPIQYVAGTTNAATVTFQAFATYFNVSYTGTQSIVSGQTGSYATTAYPTSGNAYTYFRLIPTTLWASVNNVEIGEWYINFTAGGQLYSTNFGSSWGNLMPANTSKLALSGSGQYALENINTTTVTTTPQLAGLAAATTTWNVSGVVWTVSASSIFTGANGYPSYAFDNTSGTAWITEGGYGDGTTGRSTRGTVTTVLGGVGVVSGDWLQLRSSFPLIMNAYTFMSGIAGAAEQSAKNFYIVGSNDGTNWYPIQYVAGIVNPATAINQIFATYFNVSYTGVQPIVAGQIGSYYITSYPTSGNAYTYFRIIITHIFGNGNNSSLHVGEWFINFNNIFTQPQLSGLTGATTGNAVTSWTSNNVTWTSSASSVVAATFQPWIAFNNLVPLNVGNYSWASAANYKNDGTYPAISVTPVSTTISTPYSAAYTGEWLQVQSSVPVVLYNYSFACGDINNFLKTYFIVGSNDGTTWFPIQLASMASNPFGSTNFRPATSYLLANYTGSQTLTSVAVPAGVTVTTTSYSTSSNAYTYFRIIANTVFANTVVELEEWFINFSNTLTSPQLTGLAVDNPIITWNVSGVAWTASSSSFLNSTYYASRAFNNLFTGAGGNSWADSGNYSGGSHTGTTTTAISAPYSVSYKGEWLQLKSSVPLVMYNYNFACGDNISLFPKTYLIAGSNDGTTWYPIQLVDMSSTNPFTTESTSAKSYLLVNYTGTQTFTAQNTVNVTTTAYSTSTNAYTYFRIIINTNYIGSYCQIGEWFINFTTTTVSPQLSGLTGNTSSSTLVPTSWAANNITWTATGSSVTGAGFQPWVAFNNISTGNIGSYSWASAALYTVTTGVYTGSVLTAISAPYSAIYRGEWLQIQSSVPVVLYNYSFACGNIDNIPRVYLIAGSNDGTIWYPIQLASMATNPFNTAYTSATSYLLANYTGTQTLTAQQSATVTTTSYSTSSNAYTYFRIISNQSFGIQWFELEEWFLNFTPTQYITSNYLSATSSTPYTAPVFSPALTSTNVPITSAASQTGQHMVIITNNTSGANVYYSTNYGANFTGLTIGTSTMVSCAISSDGSYITVMNATTVYQLNNNSIGFSVSVGNLAGQQNQYQNAIAIGNQAGQQNQGQAAIAIGNQAGQTNQIANSIILNATGTALNSYVSGFYVAPIAQYSTSTSSSFSLLGYGTDNQIVQGLGIFTSSGTSNLFIGYGYSTALTTGTYNTCIGNNAGQYLTTGYYNTCIGNNAGQNLTTGFTNTILGVNAGLRLNTGAYNTLIGQGAGSNITSGGANVILGLNAGNAIITSFYNTLIGTNAGQTITSGDGGNIIIGYGAAASSATVSNEMVIGYGGVGNGTNTITLGNTSNKQTILYCNIPNNDAASSTDAFKIQRIGWYDTIYISSRFWSGYSQYTLVASQRLQWYDDTWDMGIERGPGTGSAYWGLYYNATTAAATGAAVLKIGADGVTFLAKYTTNGTLSFIGGGGQISSSSDARLKNNITYVTDTATALTQVNNLKPATFYFNGSTDLNYGFIAQDVEQYIPLAVDGKKYEYQWETDSANKPLFDENGQIIYKLDKDGNKLIRPRGLSTSAIIAEQTLAIQELSKQTVLLKSQLSTQESQIAQLMSRLAAAGIA